MPEILLVKEKLKSEITTDKSLEEHFSLETHFDSGA